MVLVLVLVVVVVVMVADIVSVSGNSALVVVGSTVKASVDYARHNYTVL